MRENRTPSLCGGGRVTGCLPRAMAFHGKTKVGNDADSRRRSCGAGSVGGV